MSKSAKDNFIIAYFEEWENTLKRAKFLTASENFHLEGVTVLLCHIAAIGRGRYPDLKDRESFKAIVKEYSGKYDLFENIDLLFLFQYQHSKVAEDPIYKRLANYDEILTAIENSIGTEEQIHGNDSLRYQKRKNLLDILKQTSIPRFDVENFETYIELFSNNQILYEFARCEAVHNRYFPLINIETTFPDMQKTYTPNHQIDSNVLVETLSGVIENLRIECLKNKKWPHEL